MIERAALRSSLGNTRSTRKKPAITVLNQKHTNTQKHEQPPGGADDPKMFTGVSQKEGRGGPQLSPSNLGGERPAGGAARGRRAAPAQLRVCTAVPWTDFLWGHHRAPHTRAPLGNQTPFSGHLNLSPSLAIGFPDARLPRVAGALLPSNQAQNLAASRPRGSKGR